MQPGRLLPAVLITVLLTAVLSHAQSADDRYPFIRDGLLGYIDSQGNEVIPPRFGNASDAQFNNGLASVFEPHRGFGYIDSSGNFVIGPTLDWGWGRPFHDGIAAIMLIGKNGEENKPAWIDRAGNVVFSGMGIEGTYFADGLMAMPRDGKWGFVNRKFEFVIQPQFDFAYGFAEGRAEVKIKEKSGFIDTSGKIVIPLKYDMAWNFRNGLGRVRYDIADGTFQTLEGEQTRYRYKYGFVDHDGNEVIAPQFLEATFFSEGYAFVVPPKSEKYAIIDKNGKLLTKPLFEEVEEFSEGLAKACIKRKCGYVDTAGRWVIRPSFTYAAPFWHGLARVSWPDTTYGYVDKIGRQVFRIGKKSTATKP